MAKIRTAYGTKLFSKQDVAQTSDKEGGEGFKWNNVENMKLGWLRKSFAEIRFKEGIQRMCSL